MSLVYLFRFAPGALLLLLRQLLILLLLLRAPTPPRPPLGGGKVPKEKGSAFSLRGLSTAPQLRTLSLERGRGQGVGVVRVSVTWGEVRSVWEP